MAPRGLLIATLVSGAALASVTPALAQSFAADAPPVRTNLPVTLFTSFASPPAAPVQPDPPTVSAAVPSTHRDVPKSPVLSNSLVVLYMSTAVLQAFDVRSTYAVIERGGAEGNPMLAGIVPNKPAFIALKAGLAAGTILAARQAAKHHQLAAIVTLVAFNSVYASVVAHNFSLAHHLR